MIMPDEKVSGASPEEKKDAAAQTSPSSTQKDEDPYQALAEELRQRDAKIADAEAAKKSVTKELVRKERVLQEKERKLQELMKKQADALSEEQEDEEGDLVTVGDKKWKKDQVEGFAYLAKHLGLVSKEEITGIDEKLDTLVNTLSSSKYEMALNRMNLTPAQREVVQYHLNNTIIKSGDVDTDVNNAVLFAKARLQAEEPEEEDESPLELGLGLATPATQTKTKVPPQTLKLLKNIAPNVKWEERVKKH